ncbi:MAG: hypothetical protein PHD91_08305, partial [bacterium]|nr:hypothetical protein [bacterium]
MKRAGERHMPSDICLEILTAVEQIITLPDPERIIAILQEWIERLTPASGISIYRLDCRGVIENIFRWGETPKNG